MHPLANAWLNAHTVVIPEQNLGGWMESGGEKQGWEREQGYPQKDVTCARAGQAITGARREITRAME